MEESTNPDPARPSATIRVTADGGGSASPEQATRGMIEIESDPGLASRSISTLGDEPSLLAEYLAESVGHSFSELLFRLTHERYAEDKASLLWTMIAEHRASLGRCLGRDVGMLVAALDHLANVSGDLSNPTIIEGAKLREAAGMATRDSLTGLHLRRVLDFSLERMIQEHRRFERPLGVAMIDVDDFKGINDRSGHQAGDGVLATLGQVVRVSVRQSDFVARYGGDEIAIVFPDTDLRRAAILARGLRDAIRGRLAHERRGASVSIGVASTSSADVRSATELVRRADRAMYRAKARGRGRVAIDGD